MANRTPYEWLADHQGRAVELGQNEAMDYLEASAEVGAAWFLVQFDGLRSLQAFCIATGGQLVVLTDGTRINGGGSS